MKKDRDLVKEYAESLGITPEELFEELVNMLGNLQLPEDPEPAESPERRSQIAKKAAAKRLGKQE